MSEHELEHLLGGFAADTLTPDEQQRLYAAALQDQRLFDALADEQALKELLADPAVRRRLLEALQQPVTQAAEQTSPWWAWFRKPAGLAVTGGLAVALIALTIGTRIFQEGLDRHTRSVVTEEPVSPSAVSSSPSSAPPSSPSASEPATNANANGTPQSQSAKQAASRETRAAQPRTDATDQAPAEESSQAAEHARVSEGRARVTETPRPSAPAAAPMLKPAPSALSGTAAPAPAKSARALYFGGVSPSTGAGTRTEGNTAAAASVTLLGLRYSFVIRGSDGQNQEVSAATASRSTGPVRLLVETTHDGYLQLLQNLGSAGTRLWWPPQETGKISLKAVARTRVEIPMPPPAESGLLDLVLRFSPKPFGPLTMQEVGMLDRFSGNLLIETVSPDGTTGAREFATYVMNSDASPAAQIAVDIPVSR